MTVLCEQDYSTGSVWSVNERQLQSSKYSANGDKLQLPVIWQRSSLWSLRSFVHVFCYSFFIAWILTEHKKQHSKTPLYLYFFPPSTAMLQNFFYLISYLLSEKWAHHFFVIRILILILIHYEYAAIRFNFTDIKIIFREKISITSYFLNVYGSFIYAFFVHLFVYSLIIIEQAVEIQYIELI